MGQDGNETEGFDITKDLNRALVDLEVALDEAARAAGVIRGKIAQVDTLADIVREMEAALALARKIGVQPATRQPEEPAQLRPVEMIEQEAAPPTETAPQPEDEPEDTGFFQMPVATAEETPEPEPEPDMEPLPEPARSVSHRLRLWVASRIGSLDLKAVDGAVNENPAVVDVALLDYDGRQATLKLWINGAADPVETRDALIESLRRRLGSEPGAEIRVDFEEQSAA